MPRLESQHRSAMRREVQVAVQEHTVWIVVAAEANNNQALILTEDSLVDMPGSAQVRQYNRTHD